MIDPTKVYSVKSNARRDARKAGLDPALVVPWRDGFAILLPDDVPIDVLIEAPLAPEPPAAEPAVETAEGPTKRERLKALLTTEGGASAAELQGLFGWQAHTLRGAISTLAKKDGLTVIREVREGVTYYRIGGEPK